MREYYCHVFADNVRSYSMIIHCRSALQARSTTIYYATRRKRVYHCYACNHTATPCAFR